MPRRLTMQPTSNRFFLMILPCAVFMTVFPFSTLQAMTNHADVSALQNLYTSLNSSKRLTGWSSNGTDPCDNSWRGVYCQGQSVTEIHLSGLSLVGDLGYQLDQLTSLKFLDLSNNHVSGSLPYQLPPNLEHLNIANNNLSGMDALPYSFTGMSQLTYLNISKNNFSGPLSDVFWHLQNLTTLDVSFNNFTGKLPLSLSNLSNIATLHIQNNLFTGNLNLLANLPLKDLNVENNRFTGWIPPTFSLIPKLKVGGNNFSTSPAPPPPPYVPPPPFQAQKNNTESSSMNSNQQPSIASNRTVNDATHKVLQKGAIAGITIAGVLAISGAAFIVIAFCIKPHTGIPEEEKEQVAVQTIASSLVRASLSSEENKVKISLHDVPLKPPPSELCRVPSDRNIGRKSPAQRSYIAAVAYTIADLQIATNSFTHDNLIGEGSLGTVYRGELPDGMVVAVKKINERIICSTKGNAIQIISDIARLRHANIVQLVGYCVEYGQCLLVYDYFGNGTLHDVLHTVDDLSRKGLTWNVRMKIALGIGRALEYLHEVSSPPIVHKNLKSANVLLDDDLNPHLCDSGVAALSPSHARQVTPQMTETFTYSAPECATSGDYSTKSDVYSLGVIMLELMTGRKPYDSTKPKGEKSLVRWATPQLHDIDALHSMADPALHGLCPMKSLSRFADIIASCVQPEPEFRPLMSEVVQSLVRLMQRASLTNKRRPGDAFDSSTSGSY